MATPDRPNGPDLIRPEKPSQAKIALAFPGQGRQEAGIGIDIFDNPQRFPKANEFFKRGNQTLNQILGQELDLEAICRNNPDEILNKDSEVAQPLLTLVYMTRYTAYREEHPDFEPDVIAAHSLGKIAALWAAGSLTEEQALRLSAIRGKLTKEASEDRPGAMAFLNDMPEETIDEICAEYMALIPGSWIGISSDNNPRQKVVSGDDVVVSDFVAFVKGPPYKLRSARVLPIPYASHSPLMKTAQDAYAQVISKEQIGVPNKTIVTNSVAIHPEDGQTGVEIIRNMLSEELTQRVSWTDTDKILRQYANYLLEIGAKNAGTLATNSKWINEYLGEDMYYQTHPLETEFFDPLYQPTT